MENFITGNPGHKTEHKKILKAQMGEEKFKFYFDKFHEYFWTDADAKFFSEDLGLNYLRNLFSYRHFLDDEGDMFMSTYGVKVLSECVVCRPVMLYVQVTCG